MARRKIKLVGEKVKTNSYSHDAVNVGTYIKERIKFYNEFYLLAPKSDTLLINFLGVIIKDLEFIKEHK